MKNEYVGGLGIEQKMGKETLWLMNTVDGHQSAILESRCFFGTHSSATLTTRISQMHLKKD